MEAEIQSDQGSFRLVVSIEGAARRYEYEPRPHETYGGQWRENSKQSQEGRMGIMKKRTAGLMFAVAGMIFLSLYAIQYLTGTRTTGALVPVGIALVIIGAGIVKSGKKNDTSGTR